MSIAPITVLMRSGERRNGSEKPAALAKADHVDFLDS